MESTAVSRSHADSGLKGIRVAITRQRDEANSPSTFLRDMGAEIVHYPCFEILPAEHVEELDRELRLAATGHYNWLALTTASTVLVIAERLDALAMAPDCLSRLKVVALGSNTRLAAKEILHLDSNMVEEATNVEEIVDALPPFDGEDVLLPQPSSATSQFAELLKRHGAQIREVTAYRPQVGHGGDEVPVMLWEGNIDAITFTSETNVRFFAKRLQYEGGTLAMLDDVCVACIGPMTAAAARECGLHVDVVSPEHTPGDLANALAGYFRTD